MRKIKFSQMVPCFFVIFGLALINCAVAVASQDALVANGPSWTVGDSWVVMQTKRDIAAPTPAWKDALKWHCEVKAYGEGENLLVLEIRSLSGLQTGVDVVFSQDPWEIKKIRKMIATSSGIKTVERDVNSSGPLMELDAPFELVLPGFPLKNMENMTSGGSGVTARNSNPPATINDSSSSQSSLGVQYTASQEITVPEAGDPLMLRAEEAASTFKGTMGSDPALSCRKVAIRMGRNNAFQLWSENAPWALVAETPNSKTTLVEN